VNLAKIERTFEQIDEALGVRPAGHFWCPHQSRYIHWDACEVRSASPCRHCGQPYRPGDQVETLDCRWAHVVC
jgi:hypothetical protein